MDGDAAAPRRDRANRDRAAHPAASVATRPARADAADAPNLKPFTNGLMR
jgi:hypothetical protein